MNLNLKIDKYSEIKLYRVNSKTFLFLKKDKKAVFLDVPASLYYEVKNDNLIIRSESESINDSVFTKFLKNPDQKLFGSKKRKLQLKGLGYKCVLNNGTRIINLQLGKSHDINLKLPLDIKSFNVSLVGVDFESDDSILSGNFLHQLYLQRPVDVYKGKGFIKENMIIKLKDIKEKKK